MTGRTVKEWIGKTLDEAIPPRVRVRVFDRANGHCEVCTRKIYPGDKWQADHTQAVINGGPNRESNLRCICDWCHKAKTRADVAEKSAIYTKRAKHIGARPRTSRPLPGGRQSPIKRKFSGEVVPR